MTKSIMNLLSKWNVLAVALVAMMSISFSSCSKDDDNPPTNNSIVGEWVDIDDDDYVLCFKSNGTGYEKDRSGTSNFTYTYDPDSTDKLLKIWFVDSSQVLNFTVQRTGNTLMLTYGTTTIVLQRK